MLETPLEPASAIAAQSATRCYEYSKASNSLMLTPNPGQKTRQNCTSPSLCCRVGRRLMRALLHNEVGLVSHRRAWAASRQPHPSLLALYRLPHRIQNWDGALVQVLGIWTGSGFRVQGCSESKRWASRECLDLHPLCECAVLAGSSPHASSPAAGTLYLCCRLAMMQVQQPEPCTHIQT